MQLRNRLVRFELDYYLDFVEANRPQRFEYRDGHIFPIEAATPDHAAIEANLSAAIIPQLKRADCRGYGSSLVVVADDDFAAMPDFTVVCGHPIIRRGKLGQGVANPVLIVEILSPSNKPYDRHGKFAQYQAIMSFTDYLLIEQKAVCVEHWTRKKSSRWSMTLYESLDDVVRIESINITISLADIYAGIDVGLD